MKKKTSFAYLRDEKLTLCISEDCSQDYPLTYTLEEALEDQCDHAGWGFIKILNYYPVNSSWGTGRFSYEIEAVKLDRPRLTMNRIYADFHGGIVGERGWSW